MSTAPGSSSDVPQLAMTEIRVSEWEATARWYSEALGLRRVLTDPSGRFALLAAGEGRIALKGFDGQGGEPTAGRSDRVRLVFRVDDVDAAYERLRDRGQDVTAPANHPDEPYREIRLNDPSGNRVTLFSWRGDPPTASGLALV